MPISPESRSQRHVRRDAAVPVVMIMPTGGVPDPDGPWAFVLVCVRACGCMQPQAHVAQTRADAAEVERTFLAALREDAGVTPAAVAGADVARVSAAFAPGAPAPARIWQTEPAPSGNAFVLVVPAYD